MRFAPLVLLSVVLGGCSGGGSDDAGVPSFQMYDLIAIAGNEGVGSEALDINDDGVVAGYITVENSGAVAFRYSIEGGLEMLPGVGGVRALARGINNSNTVCGYTTDAGNRLQAAVWSASGEVRNLAVLNSDTRSEAWDINNNGWAVGSSQRSGSEERAVLWDASGAVRLLPEPGFQRSSGVAVNDNLQIAGWCFATSSQQRAVLWSGESSVLLPGFEDDSTSAAGINDSGVVVGLARGSFGTKALKWTGNSAPQELASFGNALAFDINDAGLIVGSEGTKDGLQRAAIVWDASGQRIDLNTRVSASGWKLENAQAINSRGEIVGFGIRDGQRRAFLLVPK